MSSRAETYAKTKSLSGQAFQTSIFLHLKNLFSITLDVPVRAYSVWYSKRVRRSKGLKSLIFRHSNWYSFTRVAQDSVSDSFSP